MISIPMDRTTVEIWAIVCRAAAPLTASSVRPPGRKEVSSFVRAAHVFWTRHHHTPRRRRPQAHHGVRQEVPLVRSGATSASDVYPRRNAQRHRPTRLSAHEHERGSAPKAGRRTTPNGSSAGWCGPASAAGARGCSAIDDGNLWIFDGRLDDGVDDRKRHVWWSVPR